MKVLVSFVGHIDERKRPENFPKAVNSDVIVSDVNDLQALKKIINDVAEIITKNGAMVIDKDEKDVKSLIGNPPEFSILDRKYLVPLHMITYIETITQLIPEPEEGAKIQLQ